MSTPSITSVPPAPQDPCANGGQAPTIYGQTAQGQAMTWTRLTDHAYYVYRGNGAPMYENGVVGGPNPNKVDVTNYSSFFGSTSGVPLGDFKSLVNWPGSPGIEVDAPIRANQYLSVAFDVPKPYFTASNAPANMYGSITYGYSDAASAVSMTISTSCGDFGQMQPSTIVCATSGTPYAGANMVGQGAPLSWHEADSNHPCGLEDGKHYYLNIIPADISTIPSKGPTALADLCHSLVGPESCTDQDVALGRCQCVPAIAIGHSPFDNFIPAN